MTTRKRVAPFIASIVFLSLRVHSQEISATELRGLSEQKGIAYVQHRDSIVERGSSILPSLYRLADDPASEWAIRRMAATCAEWILRGDEIRRLDELDWRSVPECEESWKSRTTPAGICRPYVPVFFRHLAEEALWFHYLELCDREIRDETMDPHFSLIVPFLVQNSSGGIRYLFARLAGEQCAAAYGCGQTPAEPTIRALLELISDGTYPEGARILLAMTPDNRPYLPSTLTLLLDATHDLPFLEEQAVRYARNSTAKRLFEARISELRHDARSTSATNEVRNLTPFLPSRPQDAAHSPDDPASPSEEPMQVRHAPLVELVVAVAAGIVVAIPIWRRLARRKGTILSAHGRATGSSPVRR